MMNQISSLTLSLSLLFGCYFSFFAFLSSFLFFPLSSFLLFGEGEGEGGFVRSSYDRVFFFRFFRFTASSFFFSRRINE